jgi:cation diffusion facilitator CzcD-associated flavoprotein CzcO
MRGMTHDLPVCVIGAGLSGLASVKQLLDRGFDVVCFEIGSDIGGNWRYDNDSGRSAAYASLHIDTSKERFAFADLPMNASWPTYLHHSQVLTYLEKYVDRFDLRRHIRFRHLVTSVRPDADAWSVSAIGLDDDAIATQRFRAVVVATGHHWNPNTPDTEGPFAGTIMHAQQYRTPEPFLGRDVVVVGVGNTGVDIACELSWHARSVTLSTRSGAHVLPRYLLGRPVDRWSTRWSTRLPLPLQRWIYGALLFLVRGRQTTYGFPTPDAPLLSQHPTVSQDVLRLVKDGAITVRPGVSRTTESEVVFVDGSSTPCDTIIYATGYTITFPFLDIEILSVEDNHVDLFKRVVPVDHPGLYFVGLIQPVGALPPLAEAQARWVAGLIDGAPLPTTATMLAEIERDREALAARYQDRPRHTIQVDYWTYLDMMRGLCEDLGTRVPAG